ncbi:unnamed protein product [Laminaria digitata]
MDRLLRGECTMADVRTINARVLNTPFRRPDGTSDRLGMKHCWMAQTITFRNEVTQALTLPTTRSLCEGWGITCYITTATDVYTGSKFKGQAKKV